MAVPLIGASTTGKPRHGHFPAEPPSPMLLYFISCICCHRNLMRGTFAAVLSHAGWPCYKPRQHCAITGKTHARQIYAGIHRVSTLAVWGLVSGDALSLFSMPSRAVNPSAIPKLDKSGNRACSWVPVYGNSAHSDRKNSTSFTLTASYLRPFFRQLFTPFRHEYITAVGWGITPMMMWVTRRDHVGLSAQTSIKHKQTFRADVLERRRRKRSPCRLKINSRHRRQYQDITEKKREKAGRGPLFRKVKSATFARLGFNTTHLSIVYIRFYDRTRALGSSFCICSAARWSFPKFGVAKYEIIRIKKIISKQKKYIVLIYKSVYKYQSYIIYQLICDEWHTCCLAMISHYKIVQKQTLLYLL